MDYWMWRMTLKAMMTYGVVSAWMWEVDLVLPLVELLTKRGGGR